MQFIQLTRPDGKEFCLQVNHIVGLFAEENCTKIATVTHPRYICPRATQTIPEILALIGDDLTQRKARAFDAMSRLGWQLLWDGKGGWDVIDPEGDTVGNSWKSDLEAIEAAIAKVGAA